jgi:uncharacterized membrane protein
LRYVLVFQSTATHKIADDYAALALFAVFEADYYHAVAGEAAAPAVVSVLFVDFARCYEFEVTVCTHVVVSTIAFQAMIAGIGGWDWVGADIAVR